MSQPYQYLPGACYHATRRCQDGLFLLVPSQEVNQAVLYILFRCVNQYGMRLHYFCFMSNHYHMIITDPHQRLGNFLATFHSLVAKCLNELLDREGFFWEPGPCKKARLIEAVDVQKALAYISLNPVRAGLVATPDLWPGASSAIEDLDGRLLTASIPSWYFDRARHPPIETATLSVPALLQDTGDSGEILVELSELVQFLVGLCWRGMLARGERFLGTRAVLEQSRTMRVEEKPGRGKHALVFICQNRERRVEEIQALRRFRHEYRLAFEDYRKGKTDVRFPHGTFKMRRDAGVQCEPPPTG